jgi:predicted ATPase
MLRRFHIKNFKSLVDFSLDEMGQFVCLTGLNGSGKTTVLQAIDFVAHLATGGLSSWFEDRGWEKGDVTSKFSKSRFIEFEVIVDVPVGKVRWKGRYDSRTLRCVNEEFLTNLNSGSDMLDHPENWATSIDSLIFQGSALSLFREVPFGPARELKTFFEELKSLELLSPNKMRSKSRITEDLGTGGEKLAGYLHQLKPEDKAEIDKIMKKFYPRINGIKTKAFRFGWTELQLLENFVSSHSSTTQTTGKHVNDGLLRILTIITQVQTKRQFLLFDEIENGINPELVDLLMDYLLNAEQQILVTTHNPVILNYIPDERAKESVFFLYRTERGETKAIRFFDVPDAKAKLNVLGPGEVFLDTSLTQLSAELGRS